jgi:acyl-CoA thioester hydrolase
MPTDRQPAAPPHAFVHRFDVPESDVDELGHAGNVAWVRWVTEAAGAHSLAVGLDLAAYRAMGMLWIVRRHEIDYLVPALGGEGIEAYTWVESLRGATSVRRTEMRRARDGAVLARAATTWVLIDLGSGAPRRIPAELLVRYGFTLRAT